MLGRWGLLLSTVGDNSAQVTSLTAQTGDSTFLCVRLLSKTITTICDNKLRPLGISSTQFALVAAISEIEPATRAEIARLQHLNRSTLTRDLKALLFAGLIQEVRENADGRSRPIALTPTGKELILNAQPAWLAAQTEVQALLGTDGMNALANITERLNRPTR
jgi:DNA-binding MarR family transcriptional regulator